ncbi:MAG TPA: hypothetical protein VNE38_05475 [Ktedonobacteraceae bacterium]|nr:hypothetical protein [Ktedonobacteraceae bacterium]
MKATQTTQSIVSQKLATFDQMQAEFEVSFRFVQEVHGQKRFDTFPVELTVRYLHAFWMCECKDRLLSIYKNIERYEGRYCLELLAAWQEGETAPVVLFLQRKLDTMPFADLTRQIHEAHRHGGNYGLEQRLLHGRLTLLNRGMNLLHALDAIFALPDEQQLVKEVQVACERYGHTPSQIDRLLASMDLPIYAYVPHQALAKRNMVVMNKLGANVMSKPVDQPGNRSWRVLEPVEPMSPFAEHIIFGYQELTSPQHNNIRRNRFVDLPARSGTKTV